MYEQVLMFSTVARQTRSTLPDPAGHVACPYHGGDNARRGRAPDSGSIVSGSQPTHTIALQTS